MNLSVEDTAYHRVIFLSGDVDLYNVQQLKNELYQLIDEEVLPPQINSVVVDLHNLFYMDSSGIGAMVAAHKKMKKQGRAFALANLQKETREVFRLASLHNFFQIYDQVSDYAQKDLQKIETPTAAQDNTAKEDPSENFENFQQTGKHSDQDFLIFKGWVDEDAIRFPADGQPEEGESDILRRKIQAKEQAIREAKKIALEYFVRFSKSKSWVAFYQYRHQIYEQFAPIVDQGVAKFTKFDSKQNCTIIFEIRSAGLKAMAKDSVHHFNQSRHRK